MLIAVLSKGYENFIYAKDGVYTHEYNLWRRFANEKCETLNAKPKIFIIQTYEGYKHHDYSEVARYVKPDFLIVQWITYGKQIFSLGCLKL